MLVALDSGACDFKFSQRGFGGSLYKAVQHDNPAANQRAENTRANMLTDGNANSSSMQLSAEIIEGERTVLQHLLSPV